MGVTAGTSLPQSADELLYRTVTAVAETEGCDPVELLPIYEAIDPDVLDEVVGESETTEFSFSYLDYRVLVAGDGRVRVTSE